MTEDPHRAGQAAVAHCRGRVTVAMTFRRPRTRRRRRARARYVYRIDHGVTIVAVYGDIDASNAFDLLYEVRFRTAIRDASLIVDLTAVTFLGGDGLRTLQVIDRRHASTATPWIVVPGPAASRLLQIGDTRRQIPTAESVPAALAILRAARPI
ncbi:STAS domain-containing protein [Mycobacterium sp. SMC-4]|uniref:STAS domain-containing protein n=1 Tax=Mycobacterium sp. SMC-4 TaxID=2857059 RepID=UPI0021B410F8|nr:STAS domain-containing protein [Mycobacterium sp. SMC-4]UXA21339.1 STAS domain-containing protein [Mycobacterium sp. SMC-4]